MAGLSTRDILLVIRARDVASRVVRQVGTSFNRAGEEAQRSARRMMDAGAALTGIGVGMAAVGASGLAFVNSAARETAAYNQQAQRTRSQVDDLSISVEMLGDMARRIAKEIPIPAEELQNTLFFIFSTMDVSFEEAEIMLRSFSKEAVASVSDIESAARTSIAIINAWGLEAKDTARIADVQFQIIRKGAITYDELSTVLGLSIPAAVSAGQEIETLGAMLSFLTTQGLRSSRASTSAARALEAFAHPKVVKRLSDMGIAATDSSGEFRPLVDVIRDINEGIGHMTKPQRAEFIQDLFQGAGGTIQARRFWNLAFDNFDEFEKHVGHMQDAGGVMERAFDEMMDQPATKLQLFTNAWQELRYTIGDDVLPLLTPAIERFTELLHRFIDMDPVMRNNIIRWGMIGSVVATVVGALLTMAGTVLMFEGVMKMAFGQGPIGMMLKFFGGLITGIKSLGAQLVAAVRHFGFLRGVMMMLAHVGKILVAALGGPITIIVGIITGLVAAFVYLWKTNEGFRDFWIGLWNTIQNAAGIAWEFLKGVFESISSWISTNIVPALQAFAETAVDVWDSIVSGLQTAWNNISTIFMAVVTGVTNFLVPIFRFLWTVVKAVFDSIVLILTSVVFPIFRALWTIVSTVAKGIVTWFKIVWDVMGPIFRFIGSVITSIVIPAFQFLWDIVSTVFTNLWRIISKFWEIVYTIFDAIRQVIVAVLIIAFKMLGEWGKEVFENFGTIVRAWWITLSTVFSAVVGFVVRVLSPVFQALWITARTIFRAVAAIVKWWWDNVLRPIFNAVWTVIRTVLMPVLDALLIFWRAVFSGIQTAVRVAWNNVIRPIFEALSRYWNDTLLPRLRNLRDAWGIIWGGMATALSGIWNSIRDGIASGANRAITTVENFINRVIDGINNLTRTLNAIPGVDIQAIGNISLRRVGGGGGAGQAHGSIGSIPAFNKGGVVPGTGPNKDSVLAAMTPGEGVLNRNAMQLMGPKNLEALNRGYNLFRETHPTHLTETGGLVERARTAGQAAITAARATAGAVTNTASQFFSRGKDFLWSVYDRTVGRLFGGSDMINQAISGTVRQMAEQLFSRVETDAKPELGSGVGWKTMWQAVQQVFPWARLTSALRPGAITATGNPSYHAQGRAVDLAGATSMNHPQMLQIAQWIASNYAAQTRELIYSRGPQLHNGRAHTYTGITRQMHFDHVHWAMANGGRVAKRGQYLTGENGPEILNLNRGDTVRPLSSRDRTSLGDTRNLEDKLDALLELLADREPLQVNVETRDDPEDFARRSAIALKARM